MRTTVCCNNTVINLFPQTYKNSFHGTFESIVKKPIQNVRIVGLDITITHLPAALPLYCKSLSLLQPAHLINCFNMTLFMCLSKNNHEIT